MGFSSRVLFVLGIGAPSLLPAACSRRVSTAPNEAGAPLGVVVSGCAAVLDDGTCERPPSGSLRLVVDGATDLRVRGGPSSGKAEAPVPVDGGRRLAVSVPAGTTSLEVVARVGNVDVPAVVRVAEDGTPPWLRDARRARARGDVTGAMELVAAHVNGPPKDAGFALGFRARLALARGDFAACVADFERARESHRVAGRSSDAIDDGLAEAYVLAEHVHDYARARAVLDSVRAVSARVPDGAAALPYYEAILARVTGDVRGALAFAREAERRARRLGLEVEEREARAERARTWEESGRFGEACGLLRELASTTVPGEGPCTAPRRRVNLAVTTLDARETLGAVPEPCPASPTKVVAEAVAEYERGCHDVAEVANAHLVLARAYADEGDVAHAEAEVRNLSVDALPPPHRVRAKILEGRLATERHDTAVALRAFEDARRHATAIGLAFHALRATLGLASVKARRGEVKGALDTITSALATFDESALALPMTDGRAAFLGTLEAATRARFDLLLALHRDERAFDEIVRSRARAALAAEVGQELGALGPEARRRWDDAVGAYHRARHALEAQQADVGELDAASATRLRNGLAEAETSLRRELGAALERVGVDAVMTTTQEAPCVPAPRTAWLALGRLERGVVALTRDTTGRVGRRVLPALPNVDDELAAAALGLEASLLDGAETLHVVVDPALAPMDVHALAFQGKPLGARIGVEYAVRGACTPWRGLGSDEGSLLLVADPRGDLPGARTEAQAVEAVWRGAGAPQRTLLQAAATGLALRDGIPSARWFHYAGHAQRGAEPWTAALLLHGEDRLDVADVLALRSVPAFAALSACEGAHETRETTGVAQALIGRGARAVVASTRPVRDEALALYWRAFYGALLGPSRPSPTQAARDALTAVLARAPEHGPDALALRVLVP